MPSLAGCCLDVNSLVKQLQLQHVRGSMAPTNMQLLSPHVLPCSCALESNVQFNGNAVPLGIECFQNPARLECGDAKTLRPLKLLGLVIHQPKQQVRVGQAREEVFRRQILTRYRCRMSLLTNAPVPSHRHGIQTPTTPASLRTFNQHRLCIGILLSKCLSQSLTEPHPHRSGR